MFHRFAVSALLAVALVACSKGDAPNDIMVCTADVKACSNGQSVGRTGPMCEFVCPSEK